MGAPVAASEAGTVVVVPAEAPTAELGPGAVEVTRPAAVSTIAESRTPWPRSTNTAGQPSPSRTSSRHFWNEVRKNPVREVIAPSRPPGCSRSSPRSTKAA